jgi:hypothetical protein
MFDTEFIVDDLSHIRWGTYGKGGKGPFVWKRLVDLEPAHLLAILKTQPQVKGTKVELAIRTLLEM